MVDPRPGHFLAYVWICIIAAVTLVLIFTSPTKVKLRTFQAGKSRPMLVSRTNLPRDALG
jgi:hypothetical protein